MLCLKKKRQFSRACGSDCQAHPERRHKTSMNKMEIRELIDATPVYPGVRQMYGCFRQF